MKGLSIGGEVDTESLKTPAVVDDRIRSCGGCVGQIFLFGWISSHSVDAVDVDVEIEALGLTLDLCR